MFFGLFKKKPKTVTVKRKSKKNKLKTKRTIKGKKAKTVKKPIKKSLRKVKPKKPTKTKIRKTAASTRVMPKIIGEVTHYFPHVKAAVVLVKNDRIRLGDKLLFKGHTTDFKQKITSIQINNVAIKEAQPGQEIGILVKSRVRHNDVVYKL